MYKKTRSCSVSVETSKQNTIMYQTRKVNISDKCIKGVNYAVNVSVSIGISKQV